LTAQQLSRSPSPPIEFLVGVSPFNQTTALQTDTSKQSLRFAVAEDTRYTLQTCDSGSFRISTNRTRCDRHIAAEGQRTGLRECAHRRCIVQNENEVSQFEANLSAEAATDCANG
jgi:hypothetical protein